VPKPSWRPSLRVLSAVATDIRPLRVSRPFRRLWVGNSVAQLGQQMTAVTIAIQVYAITDSSFSVGLVGACALFPLVGFGLYGGAVADAMDRRKLALWASSLAWACSIALAVQGFMHNSQVGVLYALVALQSVAYALNSPARNAMIPRLLPVALLPAASALNMASFNLGFTLGPMLGALAVKFGGFGTAYAIDVVTFSAAFYALLRLPKMPPEVGSPRAGLKSVVDGFRYLRTSRNVRMTFLVDLCAMVLAQPRALFPAMAAKVYGGGAGTVGVLQSAPAFGSLLAFLVSGWISRVRLQGLAVVTAVCAYGLAVGSVGLTSLLWVGLIGLAFSGAADMVSAAFRSTILQVAAPDQMRGRLQGVFVVVVAGGPRAGDFVAGSVGELFGERFALVVGGLACVAGVLLAVLRWPGFLRYDARHPEP
jgi:MFS family permease